MFYEFFHKIPGEEMASDANRLAVHFNGTANTAVYTEG